MSSMGIPEKLEQTVLNQVTGSAKRDRKALIVKLERLVKAGEVSADAKADIAKNLDRGFEKLQAAGEMGDGLVQKSMDGWSSMSQQKKTAVLDQALDQTAEFQEKGI